MIDTTQLQDMDAAQLRALAMELMSEVRARDSELRFKDGVDALPRRSAGAD